MAHLPGDLGPFFGIHLNILGKSKRKSVICSVQILAYLSISAASSIAGPAGSLDR